MPTPKLLETNFGVSWITILDHSSQSTVVLDQFTSVSVRDGDIIHFIDSFRDKHTKLSRIMKHRAPQCDVLVTLDKGKLLALY